MQFYLLDVFAEAPYTGNQLAVFCPVQPLSSESKQRIATEINFAESTFIQPGPPTSRGYAVEIFTPEYEVPFAGHPVLGTAFVIQQFMLRAPVRRVKLDLKVGSTPVDFAYAANQPREAWMEQPAPLFGNYFSSGELAPLLGLAETDFAPHFPAQEVSTGLPYVVIPLKDAAALQKICLRAETYHAFLTQRRLYKSQRPDGLSVALYVFAPHVPSPNFCARMFGYENHRVVEDAATGSAAGCLLAYLLQHTGQEVLNLTVGQGYEMNRPSLIRLRGKRQAGTDARIRVGGNVRVVAQGQWF